MGGRLCLFVFSSVQRAAVSACVAAASTVFCLLSPLSLVFCLSFPASLLAYLFHTASQALPLLTFQFSVFGFSVL